MALDGVDEVEDLGTGSTRGRDVGVVIIQFCQLKNSEKLLQKKRKY